MVRPSMSMRMVIDMKVNSGKDSEKGKVFAIMYLVTFTMAIGKKMKKMVRAIHFPIRELILRWLD